MKSYVAPKLRELPWMVRVLVADGTEHALVIDGDKWMVVSSGVGETVMVRCDTLEEAREELQDLVERALRD